MTKKNQFGGLSLPDFKTYSSYENQDSIILALRQRNKSTEQNRYSRNKSTHINTHTPPTLLQTILCLFLPVTIPMSSFETDFM